MVLSSRCEVTRPHFAASTRNVCACACARVCVCVQHLTNFCPYALISTPNVPYIFFTYQLSHTLPLDRFLRSIVLCFFTKNNNLGRDRFESTASAGRRISGIPNALCQSDRFVSSYSRRPSTVFREGRWKTVEVCVELTFQNGSQNKRSSDMHRQML